MTYVRTQIKNSIPEEEWPTTPALVIEEGNAVRGADKCDIAVVGVHDWVVQYFVVETP